MNKEILKRYFEGKSSRWETEQVKEYFRGNDMRVFDNYINDNEKCTDDVQLEHAFKEQFFDNLMERVNGQQEVKRPVRKTAYIYLKIAATLVLIVGISALIYNSAERKIEQTSTYEKITNITGSLQYAVIRDGTKIWLNPGTTISYDNRLFNDSTREVNITGEAFFDVAHNPQKPFKVHAGKLTTTVLGTAFNVEAYTKEKRIRVLLLRGHVRVSDGGEQHDLTPGQFVEYNQYSRNMNVNKTDITGKQELYTSGKIVFENLPLKDVIHRLENIFNLSLKVTNSALLNNKTVSGNYYRNNSQDVLNSILFMHGLHLKKKGEKEYLIY
ncbi:FecR domain-containing protein [Mucilaginibacter roseus]|uniref:FecR domain-containing protein n=1 Tax=Mucilaginibacter roseus TaxID=1528868 RepID=A0ABS8U2V4_9SPHI|nr:FecR domain-containing protein [Mucilaginibacter roseus]MCD8739853.1 FecR domain-containing protein [Mucilaginibacter roseus]